MTKVCVVINVGLMGVRCVLYVLNKTDNDGMFLKQLVQMIKKRKQFDSQASIVLAKNLVTVKINRLIRSLECFPCVGQIYLHIHLDTSKNCFSRC